MNLTLGCLSFSVSAMNPPHTEGSTHIRGAATSTSNFLHPALPSNGLLADQHAWNATSSSGGKTNSSSSRTLFGISKSRRALSETKTPTIIVSKISQNLSSSKPNSHSDGKSKFESKTQTDCSEPKMQFGARRHSDSKTHSSSKTLSSGRSLIQQFTGACNHSAHSLAHSLTIFRRTSHPLPSADTAPAPKSTDSSPGPRRAGDLCDSDVSDDVMSDGMDHGRRKCLDNSWIRRHRGGNLSGKKCVGTPNEYRAGLPPKGVSFERTDGDFTSKASNSATIRFGELKRRRNSKQNGLDAKQRQSVDASSADSSRTESTKPVLHGNSEQSARPHAPGGSRGLPSSLRSFLRPLTRTSGSTSSGRVESPSGVQRDATRDSTGLPDTLPSENTSELLSSPLAHADSTLSFDSSTPPLEVNAHRSDSSVSVIRSLSVRAEEKLENETEHQSVAVSTPPQKPAWTFGAVCAAAELVVTPPSPQPLRFSLSVSGAAQRRLARTGRAFDWDFVAESPSGHVDHDERAGGERNLFIDEKPCGDLTVMTSVSGSFNAVAFDLADVQISKNLTLTTELLTLDDTRMVDTSKIESKIENSGVLEAQTPQERRIVYGQGKFTRSMSASVCMSPSSSLPEAEFSNSSSEPATPRLIAAVEGSRSSSDYCQGHLHLPVPRQPQLILDPSSSPSLLCAPTEHGPHQKQRSNSSCLGVPSFLEAGPGMRNSLKASSDVELSSAFTSCQIRETLCDEVSIQRSEYTEGIEQGPRSPSGPLQVSPRSPPDPLRHRSHSGLLQVSTTSQLSSVIHRSTSVIDTLSIPPLEPSVSRAGARSEVSLGPPAVPSTGGYARAPKKSGEQGRSRPGRFMRMLQRPLRRSRSVGCGDDVMEGAGRVAGQGAVLEARQGVELGAAKRVMPRSSATRASPDVSSTDRSRSANGRSLKISGRVLSGSSFDDDVSSAAILDPTHVTDTHRLHVTGRTKHELLSFLRRISDHPHLSGGATGGGGRSGRGDHGGSSSQAPQGCQKGQGAGEGPTAEAARAWALSMDNLLADQYGVRLFRGFLRSEFSEENLEFWLACEKYRHLAEGKLAGQAARIFDDFVATKAPREINLDSVTRSATAAGVARGADCRTFDLAQRRIYSLMDRDPYPRFLLSPLYRQLVQE